MGHEFFNDLHPGMASKETRVIHIVGSDSGIPKGSYPVLECYCTDDSCDCRQVYLYVLNDETKTMEAIVSFGWEPIAYYKAWNHGELDDLIRDFKGPALAFSMGQQGPHSRQWLKYMQHWLKADKNYVKRLEAHYRIVKKLNTETKHLKK